MWSRIIQIARATGDSCLLCRAPAAGESLCDRCAGELPRNRHACLQCGLPLDDAAATHCGECLGSPPAFDVAVMPFVYGAPVDRLIAGLKYRGQLAGGRLLARQLARRVSGRSVDLLLPMPLHRARLRERGFNQASELCRTLSTTCGIPWSASSLARIRAGAHQRESSRSERQRNVRQAFRWVARGACPPRVALVDDVLTTGATARAAAACLKRAGAQWVEIWAVARTPRD